MFKLNLFKYIYIYLEQHVFYMPKFLSYYYIMSKTLVIILSETRANELTFVNFKKNVIDELDAEPFL